MISNWKSPKNSWNCLFGHVLDFVHFFPSTYDIHYTLCSPCEYTNFQQVQHTYINIHYMACFAAILFRMKMKKTQNVLRIRNEIFWNFSIIEKMKERRNGKKMYQLSFFLAGLSRSYLLRNEGEGERFSLIFYANFEKLKFLLRHLLE